MSDIAVLEERVSNLEMMFGSNNSNKETTKVLTEINVKVDKMIGKHPKTLALLKRLDELDSYTDPSFIMRYDPSNFIKQEYVVDSSTRLEKAAESAQKVGELKDLVNGGNLKNLPELERKMGPLTLKCLELDESGEEVNKEITELVAKWNSILSTLSEQFVTWDNMLRRAEEMAKDED